MADTPTAPASPSVTPVDGKTSVDDKMTFEPTRLSYEGAAKIARRIAHAVRRHVNGHEVVIAETALLTQFANLQSLYLTLEDIAQDYESLAKLAENAQANTRFTEAVRVKAYASLPQTVAAPVVAAVNSALGLLSVFQTDVEFHGTVTPVDSLAFEVALAGDLITGGAKKVFVPALMYIGKPDDSARSIRGHIHRLQKAKGEAWQNAGPLISRLVSLEADLDDAVAAKDKDKVNDLSAQVSALRRDLDPVAAALARSDQRLSEVQKSWLESDKDTGLTALASMLRAEALLGLDAVFLHAAVVNSGGHNRITRNLFRSIFAGDGLSFLGGVTARWGLLHRDGSVILGGILSHSETGKFPSPFWTKVRGWFRGEKLEVHLAPTLDADNLQHRKADKSINKVRGWFRGASGSDKKRE